MNRTHISKLALLLARFESHLKLKRYAHRTLETYAMEISLFIKYTALHTAITDLKDFNPQDLYSYLNHVPSGKGPMSAGTRTIKICALKSFFGFLEKENFIIQSPAARIDCPKKPQRRFASTLTEQEIKRLIHAASNVRPSAMRDKAMLEVIYSCGLRSSELAKLDMSDVDFENSMIRVREGKGGKDRMVPLGTKAKDALLSYLHHARPVLSKDPSQQALFAGDYAKRINRHVIPRIFRSYAGKAKVKSHITPRIIRHSVATHMLRRKAPLPYIQELLGHKNINTTMIYTHVDIPDLKRIHKQTHPREN